jgi:hypothetical protein
MRFVELRYKCRCMAAEVSVQMRERGKVEPIERYMHAIQSELSVDHARRSPLCVAGKMEYVKLPVEPGEAIGTAKGGNA